MCSLSFRSSGATEQNQNEFKIFGFGSVFPPIIFKFSIELRVIFDSNELRLRFFNLPPPSLFSVCFRLIRLSYRPLYIFFQFFVNMNPDDIVVDTDYADNSNARQILTFVSFVIVINKTFFLGLCHQPPNH